MKYCCLQSKNVFIYHIAGQSQDLKITTTEASSNKTSTTASCYSPNELATKNQSTTTTHDRNAIAVSTTTEKSKKKKNDDDNLKKSSRRRRDAPSPSTNNKRCITFTDPIFLGVPFSGGIPLLGAPNPNAAAKDDSTEDLVSNPSENCERYETVKKGLFPTKNHMDNVPQGTILQFQAIPPANGIKSLFDKFSLPLKSDKLIHGNILGDTNESLDPVSEASESVQVDDNNVGVPFSGDENSQDVSQYLPQPASQLPQENIDDIVGAPNIGPTSFVTTKYGVAQNIASNIRNKLDNVKNTIMLPTSNNQPTCNCNYENYHNLLDRIQTSYNNFQNQMSDIFQQFQAEESSKRINTDSYSSPTIHADIDYNVVCKDVNALSSSPDLRAVCHELNSAQRDAQNIPAPQPHQSSGNELFKNDFLSYQDYIKMVTNVNANPKTLVSNYGTNFPIVAAPNPMSLDPENDERSNTVKLIKEYVKDLPDEAPQVAAKNSEISEVEEVKDQVVREVKPKPSIRDQILNLLDEFKLKNRRI